MQNHDIGSIWRKWDLHIHTPYSYLNQQFKGDFDTWAKELFARAVANDVWAVGVTDYFTIDGYKELQSILKDDSRLNAICNQDVEFASRVRQILFLPNVEFRLSTLVNDARVNFHVIFSDTINPEDIEENFLHELDCLYEGNPQNTDDSRKLKLRNLEALGAKLKDEHSNFRDREDVVIGMMNAVVDHTQITNVLQSKKNLFEGAYILGLPVDEDLSLLSWDGQDHHVRKILVQKSDFFFASNPNTIEWALGQKSETIEDHVREFKGVKPCLNSSDAHDYDSMFTPDLSRHTWIKADPSFKGLQQVLAEPADRVFVGDAPPLFDRINNNRTQFIKSLTAQKTAESNLEEIWFDAKIDLNPGMVAIIGNKGSGKSALADIIGLAGNSSLEKHFSFLNDDKFRQRKNNKSQHFQCTLQWISDGDAVTKNLGDLTDPGEVERVKYIPQSYLEKICSDIGTASETGFYAELQAAIFSGLDQAERLGCTTLDGLIKYSSEEIRESIAQLQGELAGEVEKLVDLEKKSSPSYRSSIERLVKKRQLELKAVDEAKPSEVGQPEEVEADSGIVKKIQEEGENLSRLSATVGELATNKGNFTKKLSVVAKLRTASENLDGHFQHFKDEVLLQCNEVGLDFEKLFKVEIDTAPLDAKESELRQELVNANNELDPERESSTVYKYNQTEAKLKGLKEELDGPQKLYQEYLREIKSWKEKRESIEGNKDLPDSLVYLETQLSLLDDLQPELDAARNNCIDKSLAIFEHVDKLRGIYKSLHHPIQESVDRHRLVKDNLIFTVSVSTTNFHDSFLNNINQRKKGSFSGVEEGAAKLRHLLQESDFESGAGVKKFLERIIDSLANNRSVDGDAPINPHDQLKAITPQAFYEFLFGLGYLEPQYSLLWQGKQIDQLSPGERGTLLLIFYLLVDRNSMPLIIDQPEENLDNQTVFGVLVPAIKEAKSRRQIIIVTHNPNLAVVCDAEQIVYAEIDKENNSRVKYLSGAIENPQTNKHVLDVLEGTRPAFHNRDSKYRPFAN